MSVLLGSHVINQERIQWVIFSRMTLARTGISGHSVSIWPSVCLSQVDVLLQWINGVWKKYFTDVEIVQFLGDRYRLTVRRVIRDHCPVCLPFCNVGVLWQNG